MKVYLDETKSRIFTSSGISGGRYWFTGYQSFKGGSIKRLIHITLPVRATQAEAQADLDAYAVKQGWEVEI